MRSGRLLIHTAATRGLFRQPSDHIETRDPIRPTTARPRGKSGSHRTPCWREMDSNHRSPKGPIFVAEGELRNRTGAAKKGCFLYGTDGSNPSPSTGESSANLTTQERSDCRTGASASAGGKTARVPQSPFLC